jgi:hypothetical protein
MSAEQIPAKVGDKLKDAFDVHYRNHLTNWEWRRWMMAPRIDIEKCYEFIRQYNTNCVVCDIVSFPAEPNLKTEFRIVKLIREVVEVKIK